MFILKSTSFQFQPFLSKYYRRQHEEVYLLSEIVYIDFIHIVYIGILFYIIYLYIYIFTYIHIYTYIYTYTHLHIYIFTYINIYTYILYFIHIVFVGFYSYRYPYFSPLWNYCSFEMKKLCLFYRFLIGLKIVHIAKYCSYLCSIFTQWYLPSLRSSKQPLLSSLLFFQTFYIHIKAIQNLYSYFFHFLKLYAKGSTLYTLFCPFFHTINRLFPHSFF